MSERERQQLLISLGMNFFFGGGGGGGGGYIVLYRELGSSGEGPARE